MDYKQILEDVIELNDSISVVRGYGDISDKKFIGLTSENFWILIGKINQDDIIEMLNEYDCDVDKSGEYSFDFVTKYYSGDYDEYGRCICRGYYDIEYIDFKFIQTFEQRNRENKLNELLTSDFDKLFI